MKIPRKGDLVKMTWWLDDRQYYIAIVSDDVVNERLYIEVSGVGIYSVRDNVYTYAFKRLAFGKDRFNIEILSSFSECSYE